MVNCNEHDYIEIACLYRYPVKLTMKSGAAVEGVATDTQLNEARAECILLKTESGPVLFELNQIAKLEATVENSHFSAVVFGESEQESD